MLRYMLAKTEQVVPGTLWFRWLMDAICREMRTFSICPILPGALYTRLFVASIDLDEHGMACFEQVIYAALDATTCPDPDTIQFLLYALVDRPMFPWAAVVRQAATAANMTCHDIISQHVDRIVYYLHRHSGAPDMLPDILMCILRRVTPTSPYLLHVVHQLVTTQTYLDRHDLLQRHSRPFYWMVAHAILSDDISDVVGVEYCIYVVARLAAFLADRRIYMLQFCWHRLTQLLLITSIRGTTRARLQRAVVMTVRDADVPEPQMFFANLAADSIELRAWQRFFGGPDVMTTLTALTALTASTTNNAIFMSECMVSANFIYARGYIDDNNNNDDDDDDNNNGLDMETILRHMALVGNVNFLTNLPLDRAILERRNPCLVKKMSGDP